MDIVPVRNTYQITKWSALIKECRNSGLKVRDWLKENNITKDQYYYWRRKVANAYLEEVTSPAFVEVPATIETPAIQEAPQTGAPAGHEDDVAATMVLGSMRIDIYNAASSGFIRNLLEVAGHAE